MSPDGQHNDHAVVDEYPGSDLSISQLCLALKTKVSKAINSPRNVLSISSFVSVEEDLATTIAVLRRVINYHNSVTHRLPAEILVAVASYLGDDKSLIAATYISHHWRSTLLSSPLLWSRIEFKNEARALVFLERSKSALLSIDLTENGGPSQVVRESLKTIADRLIGLKGRYDLFLDPFPTQPLPLLRNLDIIETGNPYGKPSVPITLPSVRSLAIRNMLDCPLFHVANLTNFRFEFSPDLNIPPTLGDSFLEFLRSCPLLEVVFLSYGHKDRDIRFATDGASTEMISLPCLRSFTHSSPIEKIDIGLFDRLSVPPTCDVAFTIVTRLSSAGNPWTYTFPPPRNPSYLSDVKTVKITTAPSHPAFKAEFLNSRNTRISFSLIKFPYRYPTTPPSFPLMRFLQFLEADGIVHSVETLHFENLPIDLLHENLPKDLTYQLMKFDSLKTLILWQCNSAPFLCNPPPPAVWCYTIQNLVMCPLPPTHRWASWNEADVLKMVRNLAVSRRNHGIPLETVTVFSRNTEHLLRKCGRDIEELRNFVGSMEVVRFDD